MACCLGFFGMRYITNTVSLKAMHKQMFRCPEQIKLAWRVLGGLAWNSHWLGFFLTKACWYWAPLNFMPRRHQG